MNTTVYKNASIVTGLSVAERCLGFLYRIALSRFIGAEGLGIYQVALSLFSLFLTLGTGGVPITLSRMLAKNKAEGGKQEGSLLSSGILLALSLTMPVCLIVWLFGGKMSFLFSDMRSRSALNILLSSMGFSAVYAVIRGYFWGHKQFLAASVLEMAEEIVMVIVGVFLLKNVSSPQMGAERASAALVISYVFSCVLALVWFLRVGGRFKSPKSTFQPLCTSAMPITLVRASSSLVHSAVALLFPAMLLHVGMSQTQALGAFGVISGMVLPVLFIPATLIGSLALVLVPELSEDYYSHNDLRLQKNIERGLRFAFLVACILLPFFFVVGEDFGRLAFSNALAGEMLKRSCPILLPMSLTMISTSILNSIGFEKYTLLFYFIGAAALLLSILLLPAYFGAYAYVIGLGISYLVTAVCNLVLLQKKCPIFGKRWGQVCIQLLFPALICILPLSLLGQCMLAFSKRFLGAFFSLALTCILLGIFTLISYFLARLLPKLPSPKRKK